jgi:hypothetical protein
MDTASQALLIIVSATLTVFLIICIIALVFFIQVLKEIKVIAKKAENIADQAEAVGEFFQKTAGPAALVKLVSNVVGVFRDKKNK